jgi:hypothetical protein
MENANNQVKVTVQTGNQFVEKVQIVVRDTKNLNVYIVETIDKKLLEASNPGSVPDYSADQVTRLFDNVPLTAKAQEIIDRRLVYGNYKQFYDIAGCAGDDDEDGLLIDYVVGNIYEDISGDTGMPTFRSDRKVYYRSNKP